MRSAEFQIPPTPQSFIGREAVLHPGQKADRAASARAWGVGAGPGREGGPAWLGGNKHCTTPTECGLQQSLGRFQQRGGSGQAWPNEEAG